MPLPTGTTTSTTSGFSAARYAQQIRKELLDFGPFTHVFRSLADVGKLEPGHTNVYQVNRRRRIPIPLAGATEGVMPNPTPLQVDDVQGTATQYVLIVQFTDVAEIYAFHDLLEDAVIEIKDAMARLDDVVMGTSYLAGTNIVYPGAETTISAITASDLLSTQMVRKAVSNLRTGDRTFGAALPFAGGKLAGIIHEKAVMDLQQDATWDTYASRAQLTDLYEKGIINDWEGVLWYKTNFMPQFINLNVADTGTGTPTTTNPATASAASPAATTNFSGVQNYVMTRKDQNFGWEEAISSVLTSVSITSTQSMTMSTPADASGNYAYQFYVNTVAGGTTLRLVASNLLASTTFSVLALPTTGAIAPLAPAVGLTVLPTFIFGKGFVSTVDLSALEIFITPRVSTPSDVAVQNRYAGAKFFLGSFLQQNAWGRVLYSATSQ
jgi:N4-gp56 family major capsid protein